MIRQRTSNAIAESFRVPSYKRSVTFLSRLGSSGTSANFRRARSLLAEILNLHERVRTMRHTDSDNSKRATADEYGSNDLSRRGIALPRRLSPALCAGKSCFRDLKIDKIRRRACAARCSSCLLRRIVRDVNTAPLLCKMPLLIASLEPESSRSKFQGR